MRREYAMRTFLFVSLLFIFFLSGWVASNLYLNFNTLANVETPFSFRYLFSSEGPELQSPGDHVPEDAIAVYDDRVLLRIPGASWAKYADTNSMDPVLDENANGIEIAPQTAEDIQAGDIISYEPRFTKGLVVHRVVETGYDSAGWYAVVRGDNNLGADPQKIRFEQVHGVLAAIVY